MSGYIIELGICCVMVITTIIVVSICISKIVNDIRGISVEEFERFKEIVGENKNRSIENRELIEQLLNKKKNKVK